MARRLGRLAAATVALVALGVIVVGLVVGEDREQDRVESLASRLRCPVCSGESIADSESVTARELRQIVAEQVAAGRTDGEIRSWFVERYSEWVLLDPPARGRGLLLWGAPLIALVVGLAAIASRRRRHPLAQSFEDAPGEPSDTAKAEAGAAGGSP